MKQLFYRSVFACLLAILSLTTGWSQTVVTGQVTGAGDKTPIPGTTVSVKGTTNGTSTDVSGNYRLTIPAGASATLVFSSIGFVTKEIVLNNQSVVNVELDVDNRQLEEVVVVGYGTVKKSDLTGSLAQVKAKEINAFPATNVLQALSGRAPGVQVIQNTGAPGGAVSVRIRGTNSVQGSNEPLYVVDGFPVSGSNPTVLNNSDIESMEILKDASATAIYGSRGANGVVIITTKRGKSGRTNVDFETSFGIQTLRKKMDLMNATEYAQFYNEVAVNDKLSPRFTSDQIAALGQGFDWQDYVFKKAPMQNHNLTVSGGSEKTQFSVSGSFFGQDGIIQGSGYDRYSLRAAVNHDINKKFSISYNATLSRIKRDNQPSAGGNRGGTLISSVLSAYPTMTPYNEDGSLRVLSTAYEWGSNVLINPGNYLKYYSNTVRSNKVLANLAFSYKPFKDLTLRVMGGIENSDDRTDTYTSIRFINSQGSASISTSQATSLLNENTLTYAKTIGKHSITALGGFTFQNFLNTSTSSSATGFLSDATETHDLAGGATAGIPTSGYSLSALISYLGRINYSWGGKYLATVSIRADGASKYSPGQKWGSFPSAALAWRISEEDFLKNSSVISDLKLRAGWGKTGSQAIGAYATLAQLQSGKRVFGDALYTTFAPGTSLPGNLKWETTEQSDIGIDAGLWGNRVKLTLDYYVKTTRDLLNTVSLPASMGYTSTIQNIGEIQNKGLEFSVDANVIDKAFKWDLAGNIAFNRNKVKRLYGGQDILGSIFNVTLLSDNINILREGQPLGRFYGYQEDGYTETGQIRFKDLNGDNTISAADKTLIGDPNPNFIYGLNSTMSYKGLELTLFLQGSYGNDLFNLSSVNNTLDYGFGLNMPREVLYNHWTAENPNAKYPALTKTVSPRVSDRFVEDGSYLRLRNVQLAYNLPFSAWKVKNVRSIQIYASGQNLLTFTKYSWWDPEVNSSGGESSINQGIDYFTYPTAKTVTFGIRASF